MNLNADNFRRYWEQHYPDCPPVSYLFKERLAERWFRFHSLPASKRYAEDENEAAGLLERQNTVLLDVIGTSNECVLVSGNYASSPVLEELCPALSRFDFQDFMKLSKQGFDPDYLEPGEDPVYLSLFCAIHKLLPGSLDEILLRAADWKIANFFIVNCTRERIFAPYDGGVDVILKDTRERGKFKDKYKDWLAPYTAGL